MANPLFLNPNTLDFSRVIRPPSSKILKNCNQFVWHHGKLYRLVGMEKAEKSGSYNILVQTGNIWKKTKEKAVYLPTSWRLMPELYASFFTSCVHDPNQKETDAKRNHLLKQVFKCLKYDAENNEPGALYLLGTLFQEPAKSHYLLKAKQTKRTYSYQDYELGRALERDPGRDPTGQQVIRSYEAAVKDNHIQASYRLGLIYQKNGNHGRACRLFKKAADSGFAPSQLQLAIMSERGLGVQQSYREAIRRYALAADQGDVNAMYRFWLLFRKKKQEVPLDEQIKFRYHERAWDYLEKAAKAGIVSAQFHYGMKLMPKLRQIAAEWLKKAADQGNVKAMYRFGLLHVYYPNEFQLEKGIPYLQKAEEKGDDRARKVLEKWGFEYFHLPASPM